MYKFNQGDKIFDGHTEWTIVGSFQQGNAYFYKNVYVMQDASSMRCQIDEIDLMNHVQLGLAGAGPYVWTPIKSIIASAGINMPQSVFTLQFEINRGPSLSHKGHEVITNTAMNKEFKYCRDCKVEV